MKILAGETLFLVAIAWAAWAAIDTPAPTAALRLARCTGAIEIRVGDKIRRVTPKTALPLGIRPGAIVTVKSGKGVFEGDGITLNTSTGDSFEYGVSSRLTGRDSLRVAARGNTTTLDVKVGDLSTVLLDGDAISIGPPSAERIDIRVLAGLVQFSSLNGDRIFAGEQEVVARMPSAVADHDRAPAVARAPALVAKTEPPIRLMPEEPLRSAVGAARAPAPASPARAAPPGPGFPTPQTPIDAEPPLQPGPPLSLLLLPIALIAATAALALELFLRIRRNR